MSRPLSLWRAWEPVARRLAAASRVALLADFDGTLAPIVPHPDEAQLPAATRAALRKLCGLPRLLVGIVSGRSLADLRRRVRLPGLYYIGSHGNEWAGPDGESRRRINSRWPPRIQEIRRPLELKLGRLRGIYVEGKPVSVAIHYRKASAATAALAWEVVRRVGRESAGSLRLLRGKKVWELLPPDSGDKGQAVGELLARMGRSAKQPLRVVYLGDDVTDESVFARLGPADVGIYVGTQSGSRARYRLRSPAAVARFLQRLAEVLS